MTDNTDIMQQAMKMVLDLNPDAEINLNHLFFHTKSKNKSKVFGEITADSVLLTGRVNEIGAESLNDIATISDIPIILALAKYSVPCERKTKSPSMVRMEVNVAMLAARCKRNLLDTLLAIKRICATNYYALAQGDASHNKLFVLVGESISKCTTQEASVKYLIDWDIDVLLTLRNQSKCFREKRNVCPSADSD